MYMKCKKQKQLITYTIQLNFADRAKIVEGLAMGGRFIKRGLKPMTVTDEVDKKNQFTRFRCNYC
jgi:hypothetical protein